MSSSPSFTPASIQYSIVILLPVWFWYLHRAVFSFSRVCVFATGIIVCLLFCIALCSDIARRNWPGSLENLFISSQMPQVERVMRLLAMFAPAGSLSIIAALAQLSKLSNGSPIPINTTLLIVLALSAAFCSVVFSSTAIF